MIANDTVKAAVIATLKGLTSLTSLLPEGALGIHERNWRGDKFQYPNVRVDLEPQMDLTPDSNCTPVVQTFSIYVFSEKHSSQEADSIAGVLANYFKGRFFTSNGVTFARVSVLENIPAIPEDENTWRAQLRCRSVIYEV